MKLVVGLGNPGREYARNRHNVGFQVVDQLASSSGTGSFQSKFSGLVGETMLGSDKVLLLKPQTFMNRSGRSVREAVDFYKLPLEEVLVVCDDIDLPLGKLRLRGRGSSGGQNGLKDIFRHLGTEEVARLRIGVGRQAGRDAASIVLSDFSAGERSLAEDCLIEASRAVERWARDGLKEAMNEFNGRDLGNQPTD